MTLNGRLRSQKKKAFTLIELLVVIAIIALLLSILMPALNAVKEQAKAVVCASHIKQWGIILSFYTTDNEDRFPSGEEGGRGQWWYLPMLPYFQEQPNILICGKAKIKQDENSSAPWVADGRYFPQKSDEAWGREIRSNGHPNDGEWVWSSYGPNAWLMNPYLPDGTVQTWSAPRGPEAFWGKFTNITTPSRVPFYQGSRHVDSWPDDWNEPATGEYAYDGNGAMQTFTLLRHNKSINVVCGDGAARRVDIKELWGLKWHRIFDTSNIFTQPNAPWEPWME
ncbi:MAG: type II secretion system protein [Planctomycetes bacterium]|nr:type II secretion system protein [Planctomycetota bacterium]